MLHERDFYKLLGGFIAGEVSKQLAPVREALAGLKESVETNRAKAINFSGEFGERVARLEKILGDLPVPVNGKDGRDGKDVDMDMVGDVLDHHATECFANLQKRVDEMFAGIPIPKDGRDGTDGKDGADGAPGKDGENVEMESVWEEIDAEVAKRVTEQLSAWPKPKDGVDGKDGRDGTDGADGQSIRLDDVRDWLGDLVRQTVAELPVPRHIVGGVINRAGSLLLSYSDGEFADLGKVVGADGKDCDFEKVARQVEELVEAIEKPKDGKDGRDGIGFKDMSVTFDGERNLIFRFVLEERTEELSLTIPFMIYRGVWKAGGYERGDVVTRDGGSFVALADTLTMPGTKDSDWQLCCKRGAQGPAGEPGPQGPIGPQGEPLPNGAAQWPLKGA